jgi:serine/threonine-protein kinase RsbW
MNERATSRLSVRADEAAMGQVRAFIERFAAKERIAGEDLARILIAVEELVTNIVKYGYQPGREPGSADVALRLDGDRIFIDIVDDADAFDPFAQCAPDLEAPLEARRVGGLGLHLVKALMDWTFYRREGGYNVVEISRRVALER